MRRATKATFPVIDGVRWALLGDMAQVDRDGSIIVLGRGVMCINTGGEKVFPEEVDSPVGKADYRWARAVLAGQEPAPARPS